MPYKALGGFSKNGGAWGFNGRTVEDAINAELDKLAEETRQLFTETARTWRRQPKFIVKSSQFERKVYTLDKIYSYVSAGTKPHLIRPKKAKNLRFRLGGFRAKTRPGVIAPSPGSRATGPFISTKEVMHPGVQARNFDDMIAKEMDRKIPKRIEDAINNATRK